MSGWTIITLRGKESTDYEHAEFEDDTDRWEATADISATAEQDERVRYWTSWSSHVYIYLESEAYAFTFAEQFMKDYSEMVDDVVVLGANDTTDNGEARYYPHSWEGLWIDKYEEQAERWTGQMALQKMNTRYGIMARDPFHHKTGTSDHSYLEDGTVRSAQ